MEQGQLVGEGTPSLVLELTLQALGVPSEEGLGAWERPAEKRALRNVGGRGSGWILHPGMD